MKYTIRDFELELIDEPMQENVVAWERAARALKSEDAKPHLANIMTALEKVTVTNADIPALINVFTLVSAAIKQVTTILDENETLTMSSNRGMMVKAAIQSGWILSPVLSISDVDTLRPWLVAWIAEKVSALYLGAVEIPKN